MKVVLVLLACALVVAAQNERDWNRVWTDTEFGGLLYTCQEGNRVFGTYSNFGMLEGTILDDDGDIVNGTWYDAGFENLNWGGFQIQFSQSKLSFDGRYWLGDNRCLNFEWDEQEVLPIAQSFECLDLSNATGNTLAGVYDDGLGSTMSVCVGSDNNVEATYTGVLSGYATGVAVLNGLGAQMSGPGNSIGVFRVTGANTLDNLFYNVNESRYVNFTSEVNGRRRWTRVSSTASCSAGRSTVVNPWAGSFTDQDFGEGYLHLCQSGSQVWGVYSDLGWIEGTVSSTNPLQLNGRFYDGGDSDKVAGPFSLTLSTDFDSFSGSWSFDKTPETVVPWNEIRTASVTPDPLQCLTPYTQASRTSQLSGRWATEPIWQFNLTGVLQIPSNFTSYLDICYDVLGRFTASYFVNSTNTRGYMTGWVQDNGRSLQLQWYENRRQGIQILRQTNATAISGYRWDFPDIQISDYWFCDDDEQSIDNWWFFHEFTQYHAVNTTTTIAQCERNADLLRFAVPSSEFPALFPPPSQPIAPEAPVNQQYDYTVDYDFSSLPPASPNPPGSPASDPNDVEERTQQSYTPVSQFFGSPVSPPPGGSGGDDSAASALSASSLTLFLVLGFLAMMW